MCPCHGNMIKCKQVFKFGFVNLFAENLVIRFPLKFACNKCYFNNKLTDRSLVIPR